MLTPGPQTSKLPNCEKFTSVDYKSSSLSHCHTSLTKTNLNCILLFSRPIMSDFVTPWAAAGQAFLSFTISWSLLQLMSIESVMPTNRLILFHPLLLLPSIFPSIRVFFSELALHIRWPKDWSFCLICEKVILIFKVSLILWKQKPFELQLQNLNLI